MAEDIPGYPPPGRTEIPVSNSLLAYKLDSYMKITEEKDKALHAHMNEVMKRLDTYIDAQGVLRDSVMYHTNLAHHEGTHSALIEMRKDILDQEKAIGKLMTWKAVAEGKWSLADKLWLVAIAAIPTCLLAYNIFVR